MLAVNERWEHTCTVLTYLVQFRFSNFFSICAVVELEIHPIIQLLLFCYFPLSSLFYIKVGSRWHNNIRYWYFDNVKLSPGLRHCSSILLYSFLSLLYYKDQDFTALCVVYSKYYFKIKFLLKHIWFTALSNIAEERMESDSSRR